MHKEPDNLLPLSRRRALLRDYSVRVGVMALVAATLLILAAALMLIPTYLFLTKAAAEGEAHLARTTFPITSSDGKAFSAQLDTLSNMTAALLSLAETRSVSATLRAALAIPHPGVALTGFTYTTAQGTHAYILAISGMATTREALRNYQLALQGASFARSAELPVSAFARDTAIPFTITVTLAL